MNKKDFLIKILQNSLVVTESSLPLHRQLQKVVVLHLTKEKKGNESENQNQTSILRSQFS